MNEKKNGFLDVTDNGMRDKLALSLKILHNNF